MSYEKERYEYRKRNFLFWTVFLTFIPAGIIAAQLARLVDVPEIFGLVIIAWMAAFVITGIFRTMWRCPRCHKPFFRKWWYHNSFTTKCLHCRFRPSKL